MTTYQEYYEQWESSVESRHLAFDEWLMVLIDKKEREVINKACEWIRQRNSCACDEWLNKECDDFRNAMGEKSVNPTNLSLEDIQKIEDIIHHTARLDKEGKVRPVEEFYREVLVKLNEEYRYSKRIDLSRAKKGDIFSTKRPGVTVSFIGTDNLTGCYECRCSDYPGDNEMILYSREGKVVGGPCLKILDMDIVKYEGRQED